MYVQNEEGAWTAVVGVYAVRLTADGEEIEYRLRTDEPEDEPLPPAVAAALRVAADRWQGGPAPLPVWARCRGRWLYRPRGA